MLLFFRNFRVKAGNVSDGACRLSGQSLVFGLERPIAELESRIGVTPLLDLRLCAERNESTSNTCDEGICINVISAITKLAVAHCDEATRGHACPTSTSTPVNYHHAHEG